MLQHARGRMAKPALDKDLKKLTRLEHATRATSRDLVPLGVAFVFLVLVAGVTATIVGIGGG